MSLIWLNTAALAGLALIALPVAIHLLVRQQMRTLPYPSLRFVRQTALSALRRRAIQDGLLLACRAGIVVAAAAALAGPVLQTPARIASYADRIARAHVRVDVGGASSEQDVSNGAYRYARFSRAEITDAIADALRWLGEQPPAAREIVFDGILARGSLDNGDLAGIPEGVGVRFVRSTATVPPTNIVVPVLALRDGVPTRFDQIVQAGMDSTTSQETLIATMPPGSVRVIAAAKDQPLADAALEAALSAGVRWHTRPRDVAIIWEGAPTAPDPSSNVEVIRMAVPAPQAAASAVWSALNRAAEPITEPVLISADQLKAWTRDPGPPPVQSRPSDEGDRRVLWILVLVLLGLEAWLRRQGDHDTAARHPEARVA